MRRHVLPLLKGQRGAMLAALPRALARLAAAAGRRCPRAGAAVTWAAGRGRGARRGAPGLGLGLGLLAGERGGGTGRAGGGGGYRGGNGGPGTAPCPAHASLQRSPCSRRTPARRAQGPRTL